jgi:hypothetical protein
MIKSKDKDIKSLKFRVGSQGDFKKDLSDQDLLKINSKIKESLNENFKKILNLENL